MRLMQKATFAAGCFWGIEHSFREVEGVSDAVSGYTGGTAENPTYKQVCTGNTGHAEAVEVTFDPDVVSYEQLLALFWSIHNPTTRDRQGWDIGSQYRSAIFFHSDEQRQAAEASRDAAQTHLGKPIVTEIVPAATFWPARRTTTSATSRRTAARCARSPRPPRSSRPPSRRSAAD